jgi:hypothetical protein
VYLDYSRRSDERRKGLDRTPPEFFPASVTRARRGNPLTPAESARRGAAPRGALAGAAPTSGAPLHLTEGEGRP